MAYDYETDKPVKADRKLLEKYTKVGYNIADDLDDYELGRIGQEVVTGYEIDVNSRQEAGKEEKWREGMKLAQLTIEKKNTPFENASNVKYPLMTVAAIQFGSKAYPAIVQGDQVAKPKIIGDDSAKEQAAPQGGQQQLGPEGQTVQSTGGAKQQRADNACEYMNWQLMSEMDEWATDTDQLLPMLSLYGDMFRKTWFSPTKQRPASKILSPEQLIINTTAQCIGTVPRISELIEYYPNQIEEKIRSGLFIPFKYQENAEDIDAPSVFIEQHCWYDLDEDGYKEPYIVTVHKTTNKVCRVVANFRIEDVEVNENGQVAKITKREFYTHYYFIPSMDGSFYNTGFFDILYPLNESINTTLNELFDAGKLANSNTGFISKNLRMAKGPFEAKIGQYKAVNATGDDIRKGLVTMQFPGPSQALFNLLAFLVDSAKEVANIKDVLTGEQKGVNQPVGTTLALIEQGMQVFGSIFKRVHTAIGKELIILKRINAEYLKPEQYGEVLDRPVSRDDFVDEGISYIPISDPQVVTNMQKMGRAQFVQQFANDPFCNPMAIRRRVFEAANIEKIDEILVQPSEEPSMEQRIAMMEMENRKMELSLEMRKLDIEEMSKKAKAINDLADAESKEVGSQIKEYTAQANALNQARQQASNILKLANDLQQPEESTNATASRMGPVEAKPGNESVI